MAHQLKFSEECCKGCGICVEVCPRKVLVLAGHRNALGYHPASVADLSNCTACAICAQMCPDCVIEVYRDETRSARRQKEACGGRGD